MRRDYTLTPLIIPILILAFGLLLFGTLEATQIDTPDCEQEQRIKSDCFPRGERPTCPNPNPTPRCPLDAAAQTEQQSKSECRPRGERPTCPNPNPTPRCPLDAAAQNGHPLNKKDTHEQEDGYRGQETIMSYPFVGWLPLQRDYPTKAV